MERPVLGRKISQGKTTGTGDFEQEEHGFLRSARERRQSGMSPAPSRLLITTPFAQRGAPLPCDSARPVSAWPWKDDCALFPLTARAVLRFLPGWLRRARQKVPR